MFVDFLWGVPLGNGLWRGRSSQTAIEPITHTHTHTHTHTSAELMKFKKINRCYDGA